MCGPKKFFPWAITTDRVIVSETIGTLAYYSADFNVQVVEDLLRLIKTPVAFSTSPTKCFSGTITHLSFYGLGSIAPPVFNKA
jgi:hypothetical protein